MIKIEVHGFKIVNAKQLFLCKYICLYAKYLKFNYIYAALFVFMQKIKI